MRRAAVFTGLVGLSVAFSSCARSESDIRAELLNAPGRDAVAKVFVLEAARRAGPQAFAIEQQVQARGAISTDFAQAGIDLMLATCVDVGLGTPVPEDLPADVKAFFARPDIAKVCSELKDARVR